MVKLVRMAVKVVLPVSSLSLFSRLTTRMLFSRVGEVVGVVVVEVEETGVVHMAKVVDTALVVLLLRGLRELTLLEKMAIL